MSEKSYILDPLETQEYKINLGPQHPSTHGVYHAILTLNGETITNAENVVGYLHRGIEKIAENRTYTQFIPYTARLDYLAALLNNWGYVMTVEKLMDIEVPERAEYIRVIMGELQRIAGHLVMLSSMVIDLNAVTAWMYAFTAREGILDLLEMVSGSRLTVNYFTIGGVSADLPEEFYSSVKKVLGELQDRLKDFDMLVSGNEIFHSRTKGIGIVTSEKALDYGITGPNLRASGVNFDLRKKTPYSVYDRFDFDVPVLKGGDSFDRYYIRILEIYQSIRIVEQALDTIPEGPTSAKVPKVIKPPQGEIYQQIEGAKGILGFYLVSDGSPKPYRLHIHAPSYVNIGILPEIAKGITVQDFIALLASFDIVLGEIDR
jgi:NADH-quinone oxidoreductase subunit D